MTPLPVSERVAILSARAENLRLKLKTYGKAGGVWQEFLCAEEALAQAEAELRKDQPG